MQHTLFYMVDGLVEIGKAADICDQQPNTRREAQIRPRKAASLMQQECPQLVPPDTGGDVPDAAEKPNGYKYNGNSRRAARKRFQETPEKVPYGSAFPDKFTG